MAMKELLLMRHAKSDWANENISDHDRPINKRGQADAPMMGEFIKNQNLLPDVLFVSSAKRAQQTSQLWTQGSGFDGTTITRREFYLSSASQYINQIAEYTGEANRIMVIGHNPVMEQLTSVLIGKMDDVHITFPTSCMVLLELPISSWDQLSPGLGILKWMMTPKMLKKINTSR